jgi:DNA-binding MarR family transcriptional regulator
MGEASVTKRSALPPGGLAIALLRASDWFNESLVAELHRRGWPNLNRSQALTFASLDLGGTSPAELARRVGISRQSMQTLVGELAAHGLVEVVDHPTDGRAKLVRLTRLGRRLTGDAIAVLDGLDAELARRIGGDDVDRLRTALAADWGPPP